MAGLKFQTIPKRVGENQVRQLVLHVADGRLRVEGLSEGQQFDPTQPAKFDFWVPDENLGELWTTASVIRQQLWGPSRMEGYVDNSLLHPMGTVRTECIIRIPAASVMLPRERELTLHLTGPDDWPMPAGANQNDEARMRWQSKHLPWIRLAAGKSDDERSRLLLFPNEVETVYLACLAAVTQGTAQSRVADPLLQLLLQTP